MGYLVTKRLRYDHQRFEVGARAPAMPAGEIERLLGLGVIERAAGSEPNAEKKPADKEPVESRKSRRSAEGAKGKGTSPQPSPRKRGSTFEAQDAGGSEPEAAGAELPDGVDPKLDR